MKNLLVSVIAALAGAISFAAPVRAQTTYIVGAPGAMDDATAEVVLKSVVELLDKGDSGDVVRVYDAWGGQLMGGFTIPKADSIRARRLRTKSEMRTIVSQLEKASSVRSVQEGQVRLPQFLQLVSSGERSGAGDVRILMFGGPYYTDDRDKAFTFGEGLYPSDGHILADSSRSVFGTSGRNDVLSGCVVHFCFLGLSRFKGEPRTIEEETVWRFWRLYVEEMGGTLATFHQSSDEIVRRALRGATDADEPRKLDRADTVIEMRRIGESQATEAEAAPKEAPAKTKEEARSPAPHLLILIDGSASMDQVLDDTASMVKTAVRTGASLCGEIKVGLIVYRGAGETDVLPLTTVRRQATEGVDEGMRAFLAFLESKDVRIEDKSSPDGFRMVTRMHPRNSAVDVAGAMRTGVDLLRSSAAKDAPLLLAFCGDQGPFELEHLSSVEPAEQRLAATLHGELRAFTKSFPQAEILSVFTGSASSRQHNLEESRAFFRGTADAAGKRGTFTESTASLLTKALALFERSPE